MTLVIPLRSWSCSGSVVLRSTSSCRTGTVEIKGQPGGKQQVVVSVSLASFRKQFDCFQPVPVVQPQRNSNFSRITMSSAAVKAEQWQMFPFMKSSTRSSSSLQRPSGTDHGTVLPNLLLSGALPDHDPTISLWSFSKPIAYAALPPIQAAADRAGPHCNGQAHSKFSENPVCSRVPRSRPKSPARLASARDTGGHLH